MKNGKLLWQHNRFRQIRKALMLPADQRRAFQPGKNSPEFPLLMQRPGQIDRTVQEFG